MESVSVIVPIYNAEPFLDRCIRSVVEQTYPNLELILVDDGSTDRSLSICNAWADRDGRIKVIHKQNGGVSSARNIGMDNASGDYLFFCDADDTIADGCLDLLVRCQKQFDTDIAIGRIEALYPPTEEASHLSADTDPVPSSALSTRGYFGLHRERRYVTGKLIKREITVEARFDPTVSLGEDTMFLFSLLQNREIRLSYCPSARYLLYRDHESVTTGDKVLPAFFIVGKWCIENWKRSKTEIKENFLLEGFKNLFVYRYRHRKERNYQYKKDAASLLYKAVPELIHARRIPVMQKVSYTVMTYIPALYSLFVWSKATVNRITAKKDGRNAVCVEEQC